MIRGNDIQTFVNQSLFIARSGRQIGCNQPGWVKMPVFHFDNGCCKQEQEEENASTNGDTNVKYCLIFAVDFLRFSQAFSRISIFF